jgi:hypothetical protein
VHKGCFIVVLKFDISRDKIFYNVIRTMNVEIFEIRLRQLVNVPQMATQISTLRETFVAELAQKRTNSRVFSEVIAQITALSEDGPTIL